MSFRPARPGHRAEPFPDQTWEPLTIPAPRQRHRHQRSRRRTHQVTVGELLDEADQDVRDRHSEDHAHGEVLSPAGPWPAEPTELTAPLPRARVPEVLPARRLPAHTVSAPLLPASLPAAPQAPVPAGRQAPLPATPPAGLTRSQPAPVERDRRPWLLGTALFVAALLTGTAAMSSWPHPAIDDLLPPPDNALYGATGRLPDSSIDTSTAPSEPSAAAPVSAAAQPGPSASSASNRSVPAAGGIPTTVLNAYRDAATRLGDTAPNCRLPWSVLAGIGKVESDHARRGDLDGAGTTRTPIIGPVLDGTAGNAAITDTDGGKLDGDTRWDRAVGPSQFIPSSWELYGADGNNDGRADPHNVFDAAVGSGRYLCAGGLHLNDPNDLNTAVFRYNHSQTYVATVLAWARAYAAGAATLPDSRPTTPPAGRRGDSATRPAPSRSDDAPTTSRRPTHSDDDPKNHDPDETNDANNSSSRNAEASDPSSSPSRTGPPPRALPRTGSATTAGPTNPAPPTGGANVVTAGPHDPISTDSSRGVAGAPRVTTLIPVPPADPPAHPAADPIAAAPASPTTTAPTRPISLSPTARAGARAPELAAPPPTTRRAPTPTSVGLSSSTASSAASSAPVSPILAVDLSPTADRSTPPRSRPRTGPGRSPGPPDHRQAVDRQNGDRAEGSVFDTADGDFARHIDNHGGPGLLEAAPRPRVVAGPDGRDALSFVLPGGGKRAEVRPRVPANREGDELWVRYQTTLWNVPVDTDRWQLILQWHHQANTGSPPIALEVGRGQLRLAHQGRHQQSLGPIGPDEQLDLMLHIRFSRDPAQGQVDVWRGGQQVLAGYHPPGGTLLDTSNYLKMGLYRDPAIGQDSAMTVTRLRQGPTPAAVADPANGPGAESSADSRSAPGTDAGTTP